MKKLQFYLSGFLALQLILAAGLFWREQHQQSLQQQREALLAVTPGQLQRLEISAGDDTVSLKKEGDHWLLPELHNLPVDSEKLQSLLDKIADLKAGWPVATSAASHERFEVAEDKFQKRLRFYSGGEKPVAELYVGTSPGFRKVHVRAAGDDAIYAVTLNSYEMPAQANNWLDKQLLAAGDVERITGPDYRLEKREGKWQFAEGEKKLDADKARQLAVALRSLRITKPADEVPEADPVRLQVTGSEGELEYEFMQADDRFFVRRGDREQLFELSRYDYERIADLRNEALVLEEKEEPEQTAEEKPEEEKNAAKS
ncbi:DUF4340 domain-containing protein [Microbulbifer thermotolerans]|uniref:DUF4340 domain-containing protein n=1 Tax=Microbulbifer thermotolerans TaxID=252514 RepID=A0AB35HVX2_MICTH|nr:DUF4340 domain-containing protein [Microbulbifer thermotolerans]MCX2800777.1 DUF4340 domain-containing protein [Microbulbifer thermotolerans]